MMVSSGTVLSDKGEFSTTISNYTSRVSELSSYWKGQSYDCINSQIESFISEYSETISSQLTAFAAACKAYEEYKTAKQNLSISEQNYNFAVTKKDRSGASRYSQEITNYQTQIANLKKRIESSLSQATTPSLGTPVQSVDASSSSALSSTASSTEFVNYYQFNYSQPYSDGTIKTSGCGPTAMAMVLTNLLGKEVSPVETAEKGNGRYTCSNGTYWSYFGDMAKEYGVDCDQLSMTSENLVSSLKEGKTLVLSMGPGHFTTRGHYIVARGIASDGSIIVSDPASESNSNKTWSISTLVSEGRQIWAIDT